MTFQTRSAPFKAWLLKKVLFWVAKLPLAGAQRLGKGLGWILWLVHSPLRKVTEVNIAACLPKLSPVQHKQYVKKSLQESVCTFTELPSFWLWPRERLVGLIKQVSGEEIAQAALLQGKGLIFAVPHLGAWEAVQIYLPGRYQGVAMYRPPRIQELDSFIREVRERQGSTELVPANKYGMRRLLSTLQKGGQVLILPDQVPGKNQGTLVPFFNIPARTMNLLPSLIQKTGAVVVFVFVERLAIGEGYRLCFKPAPEEIYSLDKQTALTAMNKGIEACILDIPVQYQWSYKRFKNAENAVKY